MTEPSSVTIRWICSVVRRSPAPSHTGQRRQEVGAVRLAGLSSAR
ncbi:hypothetical protein [Streptomyces hygroscopicus]|nr:hypothetical protein [Streptomyces hygroscopicus]